MQKKTHNQISETENDFRLCINNTGLENAMF